MPNKTIRCKFQCQSVTQSTSSKWNKETEKYDTVPVYSATLGVVYSGSPENEAFFAATPSGSLQLGIHSEQHFEVNKEYYLDITEVRPAAE